MSASEEIIQDLGDYVDEAPIRGTRLLANIYQSYNAAVLEPTKFEKGQKRSKMD